jgi:hypothetical protein
MSRVHPATDRPPVPCAGPGCRICQLIDPDHPDSTPGYRALFSAAVAKAEAPSWAKQAVSFGQAVVTHVSAGLPVASPELAADRLAICRACPQFEAGNSSCRVCGCAMEVKVTWADQTCPENRW